MEKYSANSYYQGLLQNLYAGSKGCFMAFMQFFFQFCQCRFRHPEFEACFERLGKTELSNCTVLSEILLALGGECKFFSSSRKFLTASSVNFQTDLEGMFAADIEFLELNILELKSAISKIDNAKIKCQLLQILDSKKQSLAFLKECFFKNNLIE